MAHQAHFSIDPNDNYNSVTKDSTLLAMQTDAMTAFQKIRGTNALNAAIDNLSSNVKQIERRATLNKELLKHLTNQEGYVPSILLNEYGTVSQEFVDSIHDSELSKVDAGLALMRENFQKWVREKKLPINVRALVSLALVDREKDENYQRRNRYEGEKTKEERIKELQEICKRYNMREFTKENYPMSDRALLDQFVFRYENAYLSYKQNSDVNRTLEKNQFKEQRKHTRVIQQEELLKSLEHFDKESTDASKFHGLCHRSILLQ